MRLFELTSGKDDLRFSPFVWRIRLALAHKGIEAERVATRFLDKGAFAPSGSKTVPVIEDDGTWVSDSWRIACYLEDRYPDRPSLFGGAIGRGEARFINRWVDRTVLMGLFPMLAADVCALLEEPDRSYFRETREARLGMSLEDARADRGSRIDGLRKSLDPMRDTLKSQPFLCGDAPAYADYCAFGPFLWAHCCSHFEILIADDPIHAWRERVFDLFGGAARSANRAA